MQKTSATFSCSGGTFLRPPLSHENCTSFASTTTEEAESLDGSNNNAASNRNSNAYCSVRTSNVDRLRIYYRSSSSSSSSYRSNHGNTGKGVYFTTKFVRKARWVVDNTVLDLSSSAVGLNGGYVDLCWQPNPNLNPILSRKGKRDRRIPRVCDESDIPKRGQGGAVKGPKLTGPVRAGTFYSILHALLYTSHSKLYTNSTHLVS